MGRFLRAKWARAAVWDAAEGRCQICGNILPDDWHGHHPNPWWMTHRTNVHEIQATCPACNQKMGGRAPMQDRAFQADLRKMVTAITQRMLPLDTIYCDITTGGGKGTVPPALVPILKVGLADKICWVTPRITLGKQAEDVFLDEDLRKLFPHQARLRKTNGNDSNPSRGLQGYITTYQAIEENPTLHLHEFQRSRYILVLDECHHVEEGGLYAKALAPLVERAALRVFMSGTFGRGDKKRVAFLPYIIDANSQLQLQFPEAQTVRYSRAQALREQATVRLDFVSSDGAAEWVDSHGTRQERRSFEEETAAEGAMLQVAVRTEFAHQLLRRAVTDWQSHKKHWRPAKLLIVAPWMAVAQTYARWLKEDFQLQVPLASSYKPKEAEEAIKRYKNLGPGCHDILITVAMAYEGLDVKQISHLVCLTRYRSAPWLEQCFGRACRACTGKHAGYIYAPDDMAMRECIEYIKAEQILVEDETAEEPDGRSGDGETTPRVAEIVPLASQMTNHRAFNYLDAMDIATTAYYEDLGAQYGLAGILSALELRDLIQVHNATPEEQRRKERDMTTSCGIAPSAMEDYLRTTIQNHANWADYAYKGGENGATNREIRKLFGKRREDMSEEELIAVQQYLNRLYSRSSQE